MVLFSFFRKKKDLPLKPGLVEKRLLPRWKIASPAKIKWQGSKDYVACEVRDLNMKGFCLAMTEKIPEANARVELYFNEKYFFDIDISVIWHKEVEGKQIFGIRFLKVRDSDKEKIYRMMKEDFYRHFEKYL
ncbi:MAG: PilZ domain-containing protein [Candidatus Omnitrophica bacterium]|nr:PilZ domain-containing protein [Candidatus Omnitrophota bacterium]